MRPFTIDDVVFAAQAGCVLEASVDKPGNVGPSHDFTDTKYEDFLLSGIAMGSVMRRAVELGMLYKPGKSGLGRLIRSAVEESARRHRGRNTNLGMTLLMTPLSASAGIAIGSGDFSRKALRSGVSTIINGSTPEDTVELYAAISSSNAEVGKSRSFDVNDPRSQQKILEEEMNLQDIFEVSKWDSVARELVTEMEVTFTIGLPALERGFERTGSFRSSVLRCFMEILARVPDTLIERKNNHETAIEVSNEARAILEKGLKTRDISAFDAKLCCEGNRYNPGTTADLTASSIMLAGLEGFFLG